MYGMKIGKVERIEDSRSMKTIKQKPQNGYPFDSKWYLSPDYI